MILDENATLGQMVREHRGTCCINIEKTVEICEMNCKGLEAIELGDSISKLPSILNISAALGINLEELNSFIPVLN